MFENRCFITEATDRYYREQEKAEKALEKTLNEFNRENVLIMDEIEALINSFAKSTDYDRSVFIEAFKEELDYRL